jgi:ribosomal protein L37AE/L43A
MPSFDNLKYLEKYLKNNPEVILEQNIGNTIEYECPVCKTVEKIKIISKDKGRCQKCNNEMEIELNIK